MASSRKAAIGFIFITLLIDVMGWGLIIPVMPDLLTELTGKPTNEVSTYGAWLLFAYSITQFFCAPLIGNLSDKFGRRPVLLSSLFGFGIDYIFLALSPSYGWLFIGRVIAGFTGASFTTGAAYIADVSKPEDRAKNFSLIGAAFGLGFIIGPLLGALLSGFGTRAPFYAAAGLCLLNALYGYFVLPESLDKEHRRKFEWRRANPFGAFKFLKRNPSIGSLAVCYFLIYLAAMAVQGNWNFYTKHMFNWSNRLIGISLAVVGGLVGGVQMGLTRVLNPRIGNEKSIYLGLLLYSIGLVLFSVASEGWMMFAFLIPYCMGGIAGPALQSTMANHVPRNEQGELQGALTALMSVTAIIGPLIMNNLFHYFSSNKAPFYFPGLFFVLASALMLTSIVIAWKMFNRERKEAAVRSIENVT